MMENVFDFRFVKDDKYKSHMRKNSIKLERIELENTHEQFHEALTVYFYVHGGLKLSKT